MFPSQERFTPPVILSENFIKVAFLFLGIGILLPWNAYISAKQYFVSRLCSLSENGGRFSNIDQTIEMWFSIIYNGASVLSLAVVILVQHVADTKANKGIGSFRSLIYKSTKNISISMMSSRTSLRGAIDTRNTTEYTSWYMVMVPLAIYFVVFAISTLMVFFTSIQPEIFLVLTLCGLFICGACTAIASTGIVGTAGLFPATLGLNPFFNGQAMGGLLVACANFAAYVLNGSLHFMLQFCSDQFSLKAPKNDTNVLFDGQNSATNQEQTVCIAYDEVSLATAGYFFMGTFVLAACMVGYDCIDRYKRRVRKNSFVLVEDKSMSSFDEIDIDNDAVENDNQSEVLMVGSVLESVLDHSRNDISSNTKIIPIEIPRSYQNDNTSLRAVRRQDSTDTEFTDATENMQGVLVSIWLSIRGMALSLFFTYFCTLAVFPAWTSELISAFQCNSSSRMRNDLFEPLSFVIFNVGDLVGRYMSSAVKFEKIKNLSSKLVWASIGRTFVFFFLFLLCKARKNRFQDWIAINNDLNSWSIQFVFAVTNGILTNIAFCHAPSLVENRTNPQQVASAILNFAMTFGLLIGSFFSGPFLQFASGTSYM